MDAEENARRASRGRTGANFRAKTGGVGDVLERGGVPGADYNAEVAAPVDDGQPVEGRVVADPNNNVVDGGLNLEASILAGVDVSGATSRPVSLGDETMDDLYAEIARKNNITIDDDSVVAAYNRDALRDRGPGPERAGNAGGAAPSDKATDDAEGDDIDLGGAPELSYAEGGGNAEPRSDYDPSALPVAPEIVDPSDPDSSPSLSSALDPEVMPEVGSTIPDASEGAVEIAKPRSAMDELMMELDSSLYDDDLTVETVQIVKVRFKIKKQVEFGEVLRMVGGHESMGSWSLRSSPALKWSEGDVWVSDDMELPVDGVYVYKYVVTDASDAGRPVAWQKGNNQVLTLSPRDADFPVLIAMDDWSGDPAKAYTCREDGSEKTQAETRLVQRLGDADAALHESRMEVMDLKVEVKTAQMQSAALREEARLSSNVRLKLKQQLAAEKKRSEVLEGQVLEWKNKFKQLGAGKATNPEDSKAGGEDGEKTKA